MWECGSEGVYVGRGGGCYWNGLNHRVLFTYFACFPSWQDTCNRNWFVYQCFCPLPPIYGSHIKYCVCFFLWSLPSIQILFVRRGGKKKQTEYVVNVAEKHSTKFTVYKPRPGWRFLVPMGIVSKYPSSSGCWNASGKVFSFLFLLGKRLWDFCFTPKFPLPEMKPFGCSSRLNPHRLVIHAAAYTWKSSVHNSFILMALLKARRITPFI